MLLLTREVWMSKDMKISKLKKLPQADARSAWRVVGKQIGRAIQEGARTGRFVTDRTVDLFQEISLGPGQSLRRRWSTGCACSRSDSPKATHRSRISIRRRRVGVELGGNALTDNGLAWTAD